MVTININIDGLNIHYIDEGAGTEVLFLHGWGSSVEPWRGVINTLKPFCRTVAIDFPGCGGSDTMPSPWTVDDYADLVIKFIKAAGLKNPVLVGHSNGGRVIMKLCGDKMLNPPKIVLVDAAGIKSKPSFKRRVRIAAFKTVKCVLTLPILKNYTATALDKARKHFGSADYNNASPVLRRTMVNLINTDMRDIVSNISCPTLLIWGDLDTDTPLYMAHELEKRIPDCGLCVLKGTGHFSFIQKPYEAQAIFKSFLG